jgi:hypothetical protein
MHRSYETVEGSLRRRVAVPLLGLALAGSVAACGSDGATTATATTTTTAAAATPVIDPGDGGDYHPSIDPADFVATIDNPYLPLTPGTTWVYDGDNAGDPEHVEVTVTDQTRDIQGITAVVVRDTVTIGGVLAEETFDWFAQDKDGNVWYLGEDSTEYDEQGQPSHDGGSWEYGKDGALPGLAMPAHPTPGVAYRQEFLTGTAEDMAEILSIEPTHSISLGAYEDVVLIEEWTPLEPDVVEQKWYAPGIGQIAGRSVAGEQGSSELVELTPGQR